MKMSLEDWAGTLFPLVYAVIAGFAVAVSIYVDGMCMKSMSLLEPVSEVLAWDGRQAVSG